MLVRVPAGMTAISVQQQEFAPDRFGIITVPDGIGTYLIGLGVGFAAVTERPPPAEEGVAVGADAKAPRKGGEGDGGAA